MIVMKFGGTSVANAEAIRRVISVVRARIRRRPVVVVSAMGKTTDKLIAASRAAVSGHLEEAQSLTREIRQVHETAAEDLVPSPQGDRLFLELKQLLYELEDLLRSVSILRELTPRASDAIASFGERLSSLLVAAAFKSADLPAVHLDSRDVIVTDGRHTSALPLFESTNQRVREAFAGIDERSVVVMGGFIGATVDGLTSTLGRGGSDYSASIIGAALDVEEIQIWTDVDGMLTADPTVLPGGHRLRLISFAEAAELAYFGAKVLHPATVLPAVEKNIPVMILNSHRPEAEGTRIVREAISCSNMAKSIACKKSITLVNIVSTRMLMAHGFLRRIFEVFDRFETPVDMVATTEVSVSLTIDDESRLAPIVSELRSFAEVTVEHDQAIVSIVGDNIRYTPGVAGRFFGALRDVNIRMISQGASLLNLSVVIASADLAQAVKALHQEFFSQLDPAVFAA